MKIVYYLTSFLTLFSISSFAQERSEELLIKLIAKTCQTDSIKNAINKIDDDTNSVYYFKTPDAMTFGIGQYDFKSFLLIFETGSNLLFAGTPYGDLENINIGKKKASFSIHILGDGDRTKKNKFASAEYTFLNKKGRWVLSDVKYH